MNFISTQFLFIFLIFLPVYFIAGARLQYILLCAFNILFYCTYGLTGVAYILATAVVAYAFSLSIAKVKGSERPRKVKNKISKILVIVCVVILLAIWAFLKYFDFVASPIGISFYSFMAVSYCVDVYRDKYSAETNFIKVLTYITFFAHIVQGPFSRYDVLSKTLFERHKFDYTRLGEGILRITYGIFKKLVVANRLAVVMHAIMDESREFGGVYIFFLILILPIQLYADFSGYMDIACGLSKILGIELQENFRQPFYSKTIDEFWHRWHITLGEWFKDYLFYAVSMGKMVQKIYKFLKKYIDKQKLRMVPSYIAMVFVWTATGLWHGRAWNFLCWGWINLFCIVTSLMLGEKYKLIKGKLHIKDDSKWWMGFQIFRTYLIFGICELVSDANSMSAVFRYFKRMISDHDLSVLLTPGKLFVGITTADIVIVLCGIFLVLFIDALKEKGKDIYAGIHSMKIVPRYLLCALLFYVTIILSYIGTGLGGFAYAQF